jgi:transglutaminase-like putative cysteine protease
MYLRLIHQTRYDYSAPVTLAPHAIYLRPRETTRQRLHQFELTITPGARRVATTDPLDNALDWAYFDPVEAVTSLEFKSELLVETLDQNPFDFFLKRSAQNAPFIYDEAERAALAPCLALQPDTIPGSLRHWLAQHLSAPPVETVAFLTALNAAVNVALRYTRREEPGIQSPATTLALGHGSCRDYAVFLIELCRLSGIAARFVSGYLYEAPPPSGAPKMPPAMHAWAEVYLPGGGWRGLDPTRGIFCDHAFVAVAHAAAAASINPIQGAFLGLADTTSQLSTRLSIEQF